MAARRGAALRLVVDEGDRPALQIARDLALLHDGLVPTLRIYGWRPAGLTLGRFQDPAQFAGLRTAHEMVRRPTGGGAIWHEHELTYSLAIDDDLQIDSETWYARVHDAILHALRTCGVDATRLGEGPAHPGPRDPRVAWCFARPCRGDLIGPCGRKLCGSAMRRVRTPRARLLMHGSLVLAPPSEGVACATVADQTDVGRVRDDLREQLATCIARDLGLEVRRSQLDASEEAAAQTRIDEVLPHLLGR